MKQTLIIGTRGSKLARWQAHFVRDQLTKIADLRTEIKIITTSGDRTLDAPLEQLGEGVFVKEIEAMLLNGEIDLAVHSMKDLPTVLPPGLIIGAICDRHDVRDSLISRNGWTLNSLPPGAIVGTCSPLRKAQVLRQRPDLTITDIRGNIDTRLRKLRDGRYDAIVLAKAGLDRLGWSNQISEILSTDIALPAAGQGALGIEVRADDAGFPALLERVNHEPTAAAVTAERALLKELGGGCHVPMGAWARVEHGALKIEGGVLSCDGRISIRDTAGGPMDGGEAAGRQLAQRLLSQGADRILHQARARQEA
jgi:hydroxymethylbilane synthase